MISLCEVRKLVQTPPPGVEKVVWSCFIWVAWTFALRLCEAKWLMAQDLWFDVETKKYVLQITHPKIARWARVQHVHIKSKWVPQDAREALVVFMRQNQWCLRDLIEMEDVSAHIKTTLKPDPKKLCDFHSLRHSRVIDLYKGRDLTQDQMIKIGRWRSRNSMLIYIQV